MLNNMHPGRQGIILRWVAATLVIVAFFFWATWFKQDPVQRTLSSTRSMEPPRLEIPGSNIRESLAMGLRIIEQPPVAGPVAGLDMTFLPVPRSDGRDPGEPEQIMLGLIFIGDHENLAIINGKVYVQGQVMPNGQTLAAVTEHGVFISDGDGGRWVPWEGPVRMVLARGGDTQTAQGRSVDQKENIIEMPVIDSL